MQHRTPIDIENVLLKHIPSVCYQCEQTRGMGCNVTSGVCSKTPETTAIQDYITWLCVQFAVKAVQDRDVIADEMLVLFNQAMFSTVTNVNFDDVDLMLYADILAERMGSIGITGVKKSAAEAASTLKDYGLAHRIHKFGETVAGLRETVVYGIRGAAAYADHVFVLEGLDPVRKETWMNVEAMAELNKDDLSVDALLGLTLKVGEANFGIMAALDKAHNAALGQPSFAPVNTRPVEGKCILITGHDMDDLHKLLEQCEARGVNVFTHGEMIPAHAYPALRKYKCLVGNYGTSWRNQRKEFPLFPGPVLFTTNCIMPPREDYKHRVFTTGRVGFPGLTHVANGEFESVIAAALEAPGYTKADVEAANAESPLLVGAMHAEVLSHAGKVLELISAGKLRHIFFIGGCDGSTPGRNYFSDLAEAIPDDCLILTGACGRFRINRVKDYGDIEGIPRLLDVGQCNDVFSAIKIAVALSEATGLAVNDLPLSLCVSWFEQKAVAVLLTLLHLGIRNIRLGPSLPRFLTPDALAVLADKFALKPTNNKDAKGDLADMLAGEH
ncbi:hydroxylamine reductase [Carpediemonas membranifera]|uniref:Hydroxylamine reductase n=1 Tax=Carpediemonas membranifera TaxID=201153 RepID=A0A8J6E0T0_9EUKA|nr:hydroxylamine reductase [Carpediemonas membranifera]|eukprot:KAG9392231.1 hydroxylamine reductase [Carpediemonas membranifera]